MHADTARPTVKMDPFLFDRERLQSLASEPILRRGLAYFREHRVLSIAWDAQRLWAEVDGSIKDHPYLVDVAIDEDYEPLVSCTCPFDYEPACKHVVAALLAYSAQVVEVAHDSAAAEAVALRQQRARTEVVATHISGDPTFGTWSAHTISDAGAKLRPYRVHIRSTQERINACACADFAGNRLGTCKHIEAVLHRLKKHKLDAPEPAQPVVYLSWGRGRPIETDPGQDTTIDDVSSHRDGGPAIVLRRPSNLNNSELIQLLDRHFDPSGALRGALPDAWSDIERDLGDRSDVHLGDDARAHASRLMADMAHAARKTRIEGAIARTGGHLPGVRARLYPYQTAGVAFLASSGRAVLADDMGLGKTLQAIAAAQWLLDHEGVERVLVVCPASLKSQWASEIKRFTGEEAVVIEGGAAPRVAQYRQRPRFAIVNYELVNRDLSVISTELAPDLLILDEAQRIKNWKTKTAASIKALETRYAFVLSGTPLENRLEDLYSVMQVVDPRVLGPLWHFLPHYHVMDERGKVVAYRNLSALRGRLQQVMLRRDKRLVRDQLPERTVQTVMVPMTQRQSELHDSALSSASRLASIAKHRRLTPREEKELLSSLQRARMACDAAYLVDHETPGSPKLDELGRILEAACIDQGDKVVVFSQWEQMTRMAEAVATGLGLGVARLHGGVPTRARGALVDRFRDDPDCQVFISTDAGSTGLNLQNASVFVNLDMPWNPAVLEQRIGRIHRLGQRAQVHVFLLIADGSYEQRVAALVRGKAELFSAVIEPEGEGEVVAVSGKMLDVAMEAMEALPPRRPTEADEAGQSEDAPLGDSDGDGDVDVGAVAETIASDEDSDSDADGEASPGPESYVARGERPEGQGLAELMATVAAAQETFLAGGYVVEEMVATATGLVVLLERVDEGAIGRAAAIATRIPVAALDRRTWQALSRMGHAPAGEPIELGSLSGAGAAQLREAPPAPPTEPPMAAYARRQLAAADALLGQGLMGPAMGLLSQAMLAKVAHCAGESTLPVAEPAIWLYGEAIPRGFATPEIASAILCANAFARAAEVPTDLVATIADQARAFCAT